MLPLPKGITGFGAPADGVEVKRFTAACHTAARQVLGRVELLRPAYEHASSNFHVAIITWQDHTIQVLSNAHYPIVAFSASPKSEGDVQLEFMDCPQLAEVMRAEFSIVTRQEACAGIDEGLLQQLNEPELQQIHYWRPQRIGDVIFNYWD